MFIFGITILVHVYLFDAIVTQYIAQAKALKLIKLERADEYFIIPDWHTSRMGQLITTIVFWILGVLFSISTPNHIGFFASIIVVYCFGAAPWMYYYHVNFMTTKLYHTLKRSGYSNHNEGCLLILFKVLFVFIKPIICYGYALIFYIKDLIMNKKD